MDRLISRTGLCACLSTSSYFFSAVFAALAGGTLARVCPWHDIDNIAADFLVLTLPTPGSVMGVAAPLLAFVYCLTSSLTYRLLRWRWSARE